jgi:uncharacterized oligopeptide transporter (OPT) family protein
MAECKAMILIKLAVFLPLAYFLALLGIGLTMGPPGGPNYGWVGLLLGVVVAWFTASPLVNGVVRHFSR